MLVSSAEQVVDALRAEHQLVVSVPDPPARRRDRPPLWLATAV